MNTVQPIRDIKKIQTMKTILKAIDEKYYIMFIIGINVGLRISDILNLKVEDVTETDHVTISEIKTGKQKRFLLNQMMQKEIRLYVKSHGMEDDDYLIKSRKGENQKISRVQAYRVLNDAGRQIGITEIGTHSLRKTFGYHHYKKYHDVALLQDLFNHSSPSITLRYIGINDDIKDKTMEDFYL